MLQKILSRGGWVAAAVLALILFIQNYLAENPIPADDSGSAPVVEQVK